MAASFTVLLTLGIFNFIASIIQGVAGIGDAIFMQVLWFLASGLWPEMFNDTPLGTEPVRVVALIMYIRLLFMSPLVVYLGLNDSIFSKTMTIMMAVPSTILSIIGVLLFTKLDGAVLKKVLGVTSFFFAIVYVFIIIYRKWRKSRQVQELQARHVKLVVEKDALEEEAQQSLNTSMVNLHASFAGNVPNNSIFAIHGTIRSNSFVGQPNMFTPLHPQTPLQVGQSESQVHAPGGSVMIAQNVQGPVIDARTGLPADTTEAYLSTIGGDVFVAPETQEPHLNEENVPPLTPSKISPSRTMTYTKVRINRNMDANGKIKMSTKIGAAVAASIAGIMASLTGVNAPPQIIFILLYDAPNYIVRVNFSAQSIPSNIIRFFMAVAQGSFRWDMTPMLLDVIIFGFAGVFVGNKIGRLLGPNSFNIFVLCLLLLCSLAMMGHYEKLLIVCTVLTIIITVVCGYLENKKNKPIIEKQRQVELEVEKRLYNCFEELQRNNSSFAQAPAGSPTASLEHMQRATRPKPMWGAANLDNDDESNDGEKEAASKKKKQQQQQATAMDGEDRGLGLGEGEATEDERKMHAAPVEKPASPTKTGAAQKHVSILHHSDSTKPHAAPPAAKAAPTTAAAAAAEEEEMDELTVPAVLNGVTGEHRSAGGNGQNGVRSVHSSTESSSGSAGRGPAPYRTAATTATSQAAAAQQQQQPYRMERQSPSLHSLNSSVHSSVSS